jgi:hypothetical protein
MLDLFEDGITETKIKKGRVQKLCRYDEWIILEDGTVKRLLSKTWVKDFANTKTLQKKVLTMPSVEIGEEMLL